MTDSSYTLDAFISSLSAPIDMSIKLPPIIDKLFNVEYQPPVKTKRSIEPKNIIKRTYATDIPIEVSRLSNTARIYPNPLPITGTITGSVDGTIDGQSRTTANTIAILPQYINDSLKPPGERFRYFEKPVQSFQTSDYLGLLLPNNDLDFGTTDARALTAFNIEFTKLNESPKDGPIYIPPDVYTYNWSTYNKQYIVNRCKNQGSFISNPSSVIDPHILKALQRLYPATNERMLRSNYNRLITKHGFDLLSSDQLTELTDKQRREAERTRLIDSMKANSSIVANLANILSDSHSRTDIYDTIKRLAETIAIQLIYNRYPSINRTILNRDQDLYKLAFICGSTDDSIIKDMPAIREFISLTANG